MSTQLFEAFNYIDDRFLEKCEKRSRKPFGYSIAACLLLVGVGLGIYLAKPQDPQISIHTLYPAEQFVISYTQIDENKFHTDRGPNYFALFAEKLSEDTLERMLPPLGDDTVKAFGHADFMNGTGEIEWVELTLEKPKLPPIQIHLYKRNLFFHNFDEVVPSRVAGEDGVDVYATEGRSEKGVALGLNFCLNENLFVSVNCFADLDKEEASKQLLQDIVAAYVLKKRDLSIADISPTLDWTQYFVDSEVSFEEANEDEQFGKFFLKELPIGFTKESITRTNHPYIGNNLSGLWYNGLKELRWQVTFFNKDDNDRVVSPAEKEKYNLSLYPIPRADSVPESLWRVVNHPIFRAEELTLEMVQARSYTVQDTGDVDGSRMHFSVMYNDDIVVEVSAKGVSSEWVYNQLQKLK